MSDSPPLALVTGACGFIGSHLCEVLAEAGMMVRATDLPEVCKVDDRVRGRYPSVVRKSGAELVEADLTRPETLKGLLDGVDRVFHLGALFDYSAPFAELERVNVGGTRNLLGELERSAARLDV